MRDAFITYYLAYSSFLSGDWLIEETLASCLFQKKAKIVELQLVGCVKRSHFSLQFFREQLAINPWLVHEGLEALHSVTIHVVVCFKITAHLIPQSEQ